MTNELKTLKDFDILNYPFDERLKKIIHYPKTAEQFKEEVKQEAIKWIKELKEEYEAGGKLEDFGLYSDPFCCPQSIVSWIKHFFNIEESELK